MLTHFALTSSSQFCPHSWFVMDIFCFYRSLCNRREVFTIYGGINWLAFILSDRFLFALVLQEGYQQKQVSVWISDKLLQKYSCIYSNVIYTFCASFDFILKHIVDLRNRTCPFLKTIDHLALANSSIINKNKSELWLSGSVTWCFYVFMHLISHGCKIKKTSHPIIFCVWWCA